MTTYPIRSQTPAWMPLASEAMTAAVDNRFDDVAAAIQRIHDEYGPDVVVPLCTSLADTALHAQGIHEYGPGVKLKFAVESGGWITPSGPIGELNAAAGRLIAARAADDEETFIALLQAAQDANQLGPLVGYLVVVSAKTAAAFREDRNG